MASLRSDSPVQYVKGVGPVLAEHLAALGIHTVSDLLEYYPFRYETDHGESPIGALRPGMNATIRGQVVSMDLRPPGLIAYVEDGTGTARLRWFRRNYLMPDLRPGARIIASGKVREYDWRHELVQPTLKFFDENTLLLRQSGGGPRRRGVYPGSAEIPSATIRRIVSAVLADGRLRIDDPLPPALQRQHGLPSRADALRWIHEPPDEAAEQRARRRLAYEEFFVLELALALRRQRRTASQIGQKLAVTPEIDARIRARFPFPLTTSQNQVIREITHDLASGRPMTRLLQGDVGCGKTVVALYAALLAVAHGRQAALMAPTELLAQQHFANLEKYLAGSRVRRTLLTGGQASRARTAALGAIARGELDLIVGTQALIQKDVGFHDLALVVVDEQHKFGVLQRHQFRTKGPWPHYLVMTATPIPRTLALTVFGDLDLSVIRHAPPGRGRVITRVTPVAQLDTVLAYLRERIERGEQAYVVCPQIGLVTEPAAETPDPPAEPERAPGRNASAVARSRSSRAQRRPPPDSAISQERFLTVLATHQALAEGPWAGLKLAQLHGGLSSTEKEEILRQFVSGRLQALIATTVVEVGVDVPSASLMLILHAERYGLSQLHQLRGRVGRGVRESLCVLVTHDPAPRSRERLQVLAQTSNGFRIAEADLRQRGPGQFLGTRQHGLPELRIATLVTDEELLTLARTDAFALAETDPQLTHPAHAGLRVALRRLLAGELALLETA